MKGMIRWYISKQNRLMLLSVWSVGVKKKSMFIESLRDLLRKSNKVVHKFSWVEMSGLHLRQSGFLITALAERLPNLVKEFKNLEKWVI